MVTNQGVKVIHLGKVKYATGLYWQMLDDVSHPKKEIVKKGQDVDADLVCVPVTSHPMQAGYASRNQLGRKSTVRSMAGGLVEVNTGSWLGLFEIPGDGENYYYIAIKDDHIHAESDLVLPREKAIDIFEKMLSFGGWLYASVPSNLSFAGTQINHLTLEDALAKHRAPKLKPLVFKFTDLPLKNMAIGAGIALALYGSYYTYDMFEEDRQLETQKAEKLAKDLERQNAESAAKIIIPSWVKAVGNHEFLSVCKGQWASVDHVIAGWMLKAWACDAHRTIASYEPIASTNASAMIMSVPGVSFSSDMKKVTISKSLAMKIHGAVPPTIQNKGGKAMLIDFSDRHLLQFTSQIVPDPQPLPGEDKSKMPPLPTWITEKVTLDSVYPILELNHSSIETMPGFAIDRISSTNNDGTWKWHIEGELYYGR